MVAPAHLTRTTTVRRSASGAAGIHFPRWPWTCGGWSSTWTFGSAKPPTWTPRTPSVGPRGAPGRVPLGLSKG